MLAYGYNVYEEDNLYNVMSTMLDQHCIGILFSQCCPNTSETTLHKKCWLKAHRYTFAGKPAVSNMSGSLFLTGYYITKQSWVFLFDVGSGVYLRIARQQWTGADIDWNSFLYKNIYYDRIEIKCKNQSNFQIMVVFKVTFRQF